VKPDGVSGGAFHSKPLFLENSWNEHCVAATTMYAIPNGVELDILRF
jgi:hypothetical protein